MLRLQVECSVFGQARNDAVRRARIGAQNRLTTDPLIKHEITLDGADCLPPP